MAIDDAISMKNKLILALLLLSFSAFSWNYYQSKQRQPQTSPKKSGQANLKPQTLNPKPQTSTESYEALWSRVDSLQRKGLSKSALAVVKKIYEKATAENNP